MGKDTYCEDWDYGDSKTVEDPHIATVEESLDESSACTETYASEEHADAKLTEHHVGSGVHVERELTYTTLPAEEDGHEKRTASETELSRGWETGEEYRNGADEKTEGDSEEEGDDVRVRPLMDRVTELGLDFLHDILTTYDADSIADLEGRLLCWKNLDTGAIDASDISRIATENADLVDRVTCHTGIGDQETLHDKVAIDLALLTNLYITEFETKVVEIVAACDTMDNVTILNLETCRRDENLAIALNTGESELLIDELADILDSPVEEVLISNLDYDALELATLADILFVGLYLFVDLDAEDEADKNHGEKDADNAERVSHRIGGTEDRTIDHGTRVGSVEIGNDLLGGTETWRVGYRTAHDASHHVGVDATEIVETEGDAEAHENDAHGETIEEETIATECAKETRSDRETDRIDEEDESELLGEMKHFGIHLSPKMGENNTCEEDAGDAELHTGNLEFAD